MGLLFFRCLSSLREQATQQRQRLIENSFAAHVLKKKKKKKIFSHSLLPSSALPSMLLIPSAPFTSREDTAVSFMDRKRIMIDGVTRNYLCLVIRGGKHETFNRSALDESIHNLRHVRDREQRVRKKK